MKVTKKTHTAMSLDGFDNFSRYNTSSLTGSYINFHQLYQYDEHDDGIQLFKLRMIEQY